MVTDIKQNQILILSDQVSDVESLSLVLTGEGYVCVESPATLRLGKLMTENSPDAVILDVAMSGMAGFDLLHDLTRNYPQIPVIIATGEVNPKIIVECMKSGARDYLTNPFETRDLIVSVNKAVEASRLESKINQYHNELEHVIKDQKQEIREMFLGSIEGLVHALEFKDKYTAGHARRVTDLAIAIGKEMQLEDQELDEAPGFEVWS